MFLLIIFFRFVFPSCYDAVPGNATACAREQVPMVREDLPGQLNERRLQQLDSTAMTLTSPLARTVLSFNSAFVFFPNDFSVGLLDFSAAAPRCWNFKRASHRRLGSAIGVMGLIFRS